MPQNQLIYILLFSFFLTSSIGHESNTQALAVVEQPTEQEDSTEATTSTNLDASQPIDIFEPTEEWKEILPHQQIPGGLHVRISLQTGKKEAKLLTRETPANEVANPTSTDSEVNDTAPTDTETTKTTSEAILDETMESDMEEQPNEAIDRLAGVLKSLPEPPNIHSMDINEAYQKLSPELFRNEIVKIWKERQQLLIEATESMETAVSGMQRILEELFQDELASSERQAVLLEELEWEVQDLDKAKDFNSIGGLSAIVQYLNATDLNVRANAAWVIGSTVKHYVEAQHWALDYGALIMILQSLAEFDVVKVQVENQALFNMQKKMLYALAALLRLNERAQSNFWMHNGVEHLAQFTTPETHDGIKLKVSTIVRDLLEEQPQNEAHAASLKELHDAFHSTKWCKLVPSLLSAEKDEVIKNILYAIRAQQRGCNELFKTKSFQVLLQSLSEKLNETPIHDEIRLIINELVDSPVE